MKNPFCSKAFIFAIALSAAAHAAADQTFSQSNLMYVSAGNPDSAFPYSSPDTAAPDIETAVSAAGDGTVISVGEGIYPVSTPLLLTNAVHIIGEGIDPSRVMVSNIYEANQIIGNRRVFTLSNKDALVANLTIASGDLKAYGEKGSCFNITSEGGMVSNCIVTAGSCNSVGNSSSAGGHLDGGMVTHTLFFGNRSLSSTPAWDEIRAGVLSMAGTARAENCLFRDNGHPKELVTLIKADGSSCLRNCTIVNSVLSNTNAEKYVVSPVWVGSGATVENVVIAGVTNDQGEPLKPAGTVSRMSHCATDTEEKVNPDCFTGSVTNFFCNYAMGDFRPAPYSVLVDNGVDYSPMPLYDFSGKQPRKIGRVDIGCYEANSPAFLFFVK